MDPDNRRPKAYRDILLRDLSPKRLYVIGVHRYDHIVGYVIRRWKPSHDRGFNDLAAKAQRQKPLCKRYEQTGKSIRYPAANRLMQ